MIYLDYHATTPCDPHVVAAMMPFFTETFGNPSSSLHSTGRTASAAVDQAREQVATLLGAHASEIVFTSGATESNNLALLGLARANPKNRHRIVTTAIEHKAVLAPCHELEKSGFELVILPVQSDGRIDLELARQVITNDTLVVAIQAANNEIGTIQSIAEIAELAHSCGAFVQCDAAQAVGKIPMDVEAWDVDLLSISGHKLYGPKGIGVLYIRNGVYSFPIKPLVFGGGQERELRPGTLNVPGIVGLGTACELCEQALPREAARVSNLRNAFETAILEALPNVRRNGAIENRLPGNCSLLFPNIDAEALIANTPNLALSTGSACTSGAPEPSHVLLAIGLSREEAYSTVRVGIGRFTTDDEVHQAATEIIRVAQRLLKIQNKTDIAKSMTAELIGSQ